MENLITLNWAYLELRSFEKMYCCHVTLLIGVQGEEMGDCGRHVPSYLQMGAGDGAQVG